MTELNKPVSRRTRLPHRRGRRVIVTLHPGDVLSFRDERTRAEFFLSVGAAYDVAVKLYVAAKKTERRAAAGKR